MQGRFRDRRDAGERLAAALAGYAGRSGLQVLALPRGGVPVGAAVARALGAPLDVLVVRKLGAPGQRELAIGAVASGGVRVLNDALVAALDLDEAAIGAIAAQEERELARREAVYRRGAAPPAVAGRTVLLVDDGLATGATMEAAVRVVRRLGAGAVVVAVPVASSDAVERLEPLADDVVCLLLPDELVSVGGWYRDFAQTTDAEVLALLDDSAKGLDRGGAP